MLGVAMQTTIKTLFEKGYNKAQIARMLNIDRKTEGKIVKVKEILEETGIDRKKLDKLRSNNIFVKDWFNTHKAEINGTYLI
ncbi:hypothetical protein [Clostridium sp.]|uniref:hypothetical protein n=1 Tax=Clostridium sp. TaxID=1506 RepID=UPI0035A136D7